MLTCAEMVELTTEYLEGRLPISERLRFQWHLGVCLDCRRYLRQMKTTIATLHQYPTEESIPPEVRDELLARFRNWNVDRSR